MLVQPCPGKSSNYTIRGTVKASHKSRSIKENKGVANRKRAEEIRRRRENEMLEELIQGVKPRHFFAGDCTMILTPDAGCPPFVMVNDRSEWVSTIVSAPGWLLG
jgi:hypothetical protein